jgi:hypothetical protein
LRTEAKATLPVGFQGKAVWASENKDNNKKVMIGSLERVR